MKKSKTFYLNINLFRFHLTRLIKGILIMNYGKLQLSFILLLIMTILQFLVAVLVLHHMLITILSIIAAILCIIGLIFIQHKMH